MIERMEVEGRMGTVAYVTNDMEPVSPEESDMVKVVFDSDEVVFAVKAVKAEQDKRKSEYAIEKRWAQALLKD